MKKTIKLLFVITFIFLLAATLCSCSKGELNGRYESKNNDGTVFYFYDNNEVHTSVMKYDAMYDMYVATWYGGEYKIFEDPQNPGSLLIEFNMSNQGTYTYSFKETENGIIIDGEEFALASQYPNNFWIYNKLANMGVTKIKFIDNILRRIFPINQLFFKENSERIPSRYFV